jgi:hypothetical protein
MFTHAPIGITLVVTLAALHHLMLRVEALRTGTRAYGLVVATLPVDGASRTFDAPLVRFLDHEGRERHFRLVAGRLIAPRVGSTVEVLYWVLVCLPRLHWLVPPMLQRRLPAQLGNDVSAIDSELQHLRFSTSRGSALVLGALADVEAAGADEGLRVHRSWWVAYWHASSVRRSATGSVRQISDGRQVSVRRQFCVSAYSAPAIS